MELVLPSVGGAVLELDLGRLAGNVIRIIRFLPTLSTGSKVPVPAGGLTFLSPNKKVSKEVGQGEALSC